jgi:adenylate cyclase class IV
MFEIEKKFEIPASFITELESNLAKKGYKFDKQISITDYYASFELSPIKENSYDFLRFRETTDNVIRTQKTWVFVENQFQRQEDEEVYGGTIPESKYVLNKERKIYHNDNPLLPEVTLDILTINNKIRYFVEAELVTEHKDEIVEATAKVLDILSQVLNKDLTNVPQAPTMLQLLMEEAQSS